MGSIDNFLMQVDDESLETESECSSDNVETERAIPKTAVTTTTAYSDCSDDDEHSHTKRFVSTAVGYCFTPTSECFHRAYGYVYCIDLN